MKKTCPAYFLIVSDYFFPCGYVSIYVLVQIIEKMNGQGAGAETIPFSVAVKAQGNIEDWLCDLLFKMQVLNYTLMLL